MDDRKDSNLNDPNPPSPIFFVLTKMKFYQCYSSIGTQKKNNLKKTLPPKSKNIERRCRGSNPGHPRDRRVYSPLYYIDF